LTARHASSYGGAFGAASFRGADRESERHGGGYRLCANECIDVGHALPASSFAVPALYRQTRIILGAEGDRQGGGWRRERISGASGAARRIERRLRHSGHRHGFNRRIYGAVLLRALSAYIKRLYALR